MLTLYAIPPSLYCAKVRLCLRAKGLEWAEVLPPGGYGSAEYKALVPAGNLPALIIEDERIIADSEAINEYLDETYPAPALMLETPVARAHVRACSRFHDTRLEPAVRALFAHVSPAERDASFVAGQTVVINQRLAQMIQIAEPNPLMHGEKLTLADCGYPITFAVLDALAGPMNLKLDWPKTVLHYRDGLAANEWVAAELISYVPTFAAWVEQATTP